MNTWGTEAHVMRCRMASVGVTWGGRWSVRPACVRRWSGVSEWTLVALVRVSAAHGGSRHVMDMVGPWAVGLWGRVGFGVVVGRVD
jgi:hypothetical protein